MMKILCNCGEELEIKEYELEDGDEEKRFDGLMGVVERGSKLSVTTESIDDDFITFFKCANCGKFVWWN